MVQIDDLLAEYVQGTISEEKGLPITKENYERLIEDLREKERNSHGIVKNDQVIKFLREWFE
jgi:hypothetical protein